MTPRTCLLLMLLAHVASLLLIPGFAHATTFVCGSLSGNVQWTPSGSPYVVCSSGAVLTSGSTLAIDPGVIVKLENGARLTINGTLQAIGTQVDSIIVTSIHDDAYGGDTNNNGGGTVPARGDWDFLWLNGTASSVLEYCHVRYAGQVDGAIYFDGNATVRRCLVALSGTPTR